MQSVICHFKPVNLKHKFRKSGMRGSKLKNNYLILNSLLARKAVSSKSLKRRLASKSETWKQKMVSSKKKLHGLERTKNYSQTEKMIKNLVTRSSMS